MSISPRSVSPRSPRNLNRSQRGHTRPPNYVEVKSGSDRITQLSTPRYRVTGSDYLVNSNGFGGYSSPRVSHDQQTVFQSHERMLKRVDEQHASGASENRATISQRTVPKIPTAVELLTSLKAHHNETNKNNTNNARTIDNIDGSHNNNNNKSVSSSSPRSLLANTTRGVGSQVGMAGLILAQSNMLEDLAAIQGTKLQKHELCNTIVRRAQVDSGRFPVHIPTSGRRKAGDNIINNNNNNNNNENSGSSSARETTKTLIIHAPSPSAVRSLAISGIDTSRVNARPVAPEYFNQEQKQNVRPTRNGSCRYPETMWMSQPTQESGHYLPTPHQFNPNDRGLHNASTYILEDKLRRKATNEIRISKRGWNEEAVDARAQAEIDFKKSRNDKRVAVKRQARLDYEERVGAGM